MVIFEILEEWTKRRKEEKNLYRVLKGLTHQRDDDIQEEKKCSEPITTLGKFSELHSFLSLQNYHLPG